MAKAVDIEVTFTGICAFVETASGGTAAVMPNVRKHGAHPHVPWMAVSRDKTLEYFVVFMTNGSLEIEGMPPGKVDPAGPDTTDDKPTAGKNDRSSRWLTRFRQIEPTAKLKKVYTEPGHPDDVALWVDVPAGKLRTRNVSGCAWETKSKNDTTPKTSHSMAQEASVRSTVQIVGDQFRIVHRDLDADKQTVFTVVVDGAKSIEIMIGHTGWMDVNSQGTQKSPDEHFSIYYDMLDTAVAADDRRLPHKKSGCIEILRLNGANCPPVFMFDAPIP